MRRSPRAAGRLPRHPADGLLVEPEPDLGAVGVEVGPEPEGPPVGFPAGVVRRQGPCAAGPVLAPTIETIARPSSVHTAPIMTGNGSYR